MNPRALAGYGSPAAYISAGSLLVFFVLQQAGGSIAASAPRLVVPLEITFIVALWLWIGGLAVVVFDLVRRAHPASGAPSLRAARWATVLALVMPVGLVISVFAGVNVLQPISFLALFACAGISQLGHNLAARRAGFLRGVLPWLGMATGVAYILAGLGFGTLLFSIGTTFFMVGFNILELGQTLFIVWAIWLGVKLSRSQAAIPAAA